MKDEASFSTSSTNGTQYAAVASSEVPSQYDKEYELTSATACVDLGQVLSSSATAALYVDKPAIQPMDPRYANLAELRNLTWTDTFFDDDEGVIAVFDFDYDAMEDYYTSIGWASLAATMLYAPIFLASLVGLAPCYLRKNVVWSSRAQHVAITRDGIRFVRNRRSCCWGMPCTDQGKSSKTVPFDKITDCDVEEPAGNTCLCIPKVLTILNVDTASSGTDGRKELRIAGLKDPHSFKKLVWAMKRSQQQGWQTPRGDAASITTTTTTTASGTNNEDVTWALLREIRDELRTNNELLRTKNNMQPSAPAEVAFPAEPSTSVAAEEEHTMNAIV